MVVDVKAAGVSFPEVLQTRGEYQFKPPLPFVPGSEVGGVVRSAPDGAAVKPGDRVAAFCMLGGFAEVVVAPEYFCFTLPDALDFAQGASLVLNYHTAYFALKLRGRLAEGETVLVHGAAGGVGTAVAPGRQGPRSARRSRSSPATRRSRSRARRAPTTWSAPTARGRTRPRRSPAAASTSCSTRSAATASPTACARCARVAGVVVVGFTGGSIPEVRVNRLLLGNTEVVGAGWGAYVMSKPEVTQQIGAEIAELIDRGFVAPIVGARFPLERAAEALNAIDGREATGKVVLEV